jgi:hypothetical protein
MAAISIVCRFSFSLILFLSIYSKIVSAIYLSASPDGKQYICNSSFSPYSLFLNRSSFQEAQDKCQLFGKGLAVLDTPNDLLQIAFLMYECSLLAGESVSAAWMNSAQEKLLSGQNSPCLAVDARGGVIAGSPSLCALNMNMPVVCKQSPLSEASKNFNIGKEKSNRFLQSLKGLNESAAFSKIIALAELEQPPHHRGYDDNIPSSSNSYDSSTFSRAEHGNENGAEGDPFENRQASSQDFFAQSSHFPSRTIPEVVNIDSGEEIQWTTPTPTCSPGGSSCESCLPIPNLQVAPFHLLGFKLIQTKLPYDQADCACRQLGMHLATPNFVTQWLAALVLYQGALMSKPLAWINSPASQGSCLALRASQLLWNGPHIEAHDCFDSLPVLCQGSIFLQWGEVLDSIQMMDKVARFIPGMEKMPQMCPLMKEMITSLGEISNIPEMDQLLDLLFNSFKFPAAAYSSDLLDTTTSHSTERMEIQNGATEKITLRKSSPNSKQIFKSPLNNPMVPAVHPRKDNPDDREALAEALERPIRDMLTSQFGPQVASQITSQMASIVAGMLDQKPRPNHQSVAGLLSSLFPGTTGPVQRPINLAEQARAQIVGSVDNLYIIETSFKSPEAACKTLSLELGAYSISNIDRIAKWSRENGVITGFVDEKGLSHTVFPNGAIYHQLTKFAKSSNTHAVCQLPKFYAV